jgi:hypothetical protein
MELTVMICPDFCARNRGSSAFVTLTVPQCRRPRDFVEN